MVKPSRAVYIAYPFGHTFGDLNDREQQRRILLHCLDAAKDITAAGAIVDLPYRWTKNDLRLRQLLKQAH